MYKQTKINHAGVLSEWPQFDKQVQLQYESKGYLNATRGQTNSSGSATWTRMVLLPVVHILQHMAVSQMPQDIVCPLPVNRVVGVKRTVMWNIGSSLSSLPVLKVPVVYYCCAGEMLFLFKGAIFNVKLYFLSSFTLFTFDVSIRYWTDRQIVS